jgi:hypothetical protein
MAEATSVPNGWSPTQLFTMFTKLMEESDRRFTDRFASLDNTMAAQQAAGTKLFDLQQAANDKLFDLQKTVAETTSKTAKEAVDAALVAQKEAVDKAEKAQEKRFDALNEKLGLMEATVGTALAERSGRSGGIKDIWAAVMGSASLASIAVIVGSKLLGK